VPIITIAATSFSNSVAGAARGNRFKVPFPCRVVGMRIATNTATGGSALSLTDDAGAELSSSSTTYDADQSLNTAGQTSLFFDSPVTLATGTWYRMVITPDSATNTTYNLCTLPSAAYFTALGYGTDIMYATFTTAGGWVDTATTQFVPMDLLIDQIDNGVGAGSAAAKVIGG
jgi:hypothetical protein